MPHVLDSAKPRTQHCWWELRLAMPEGALGGLGSWRQWSIEAGMCELLRLHALGKV